MPPSPVIARIPNPRIPLIIAGNLFIVIDDGAAVASDYPFMQRIVTTEALRYPAGLACVTIIPAASRPPADDIRRAIREAYANVAKCLASVCWMVEGSGFKAGATRAALAGIRLLIRPPYPTHITTELRDAVIWSRTQAGATDNTDLDRLLNRINELRHNFERRPKDKFVEQP